MGLKTITKWFGLKVCKSGEQRIYTIDRTVKEKIVLFKLGNQYSIWAIIGRERFH